VSRRARAAFAFIAPPILALGLAACFVMNGLVADQGDGGKHKSPSDPDPEDDGGTQPVGDGGGPAQGPCDINAPFTQFPALSELNTADDEELPRLTRDELTIYYFGFTDAGTAMHFAERSQPGATFGAPKPLFANLAEPAAPSPAPSPLRLYYADGPGDLSLQLAERAAPTDPFTPSRTVLQHGQLEALSYPATFDGPSGATGIFFVHWKYQDANDDTGQTDLWQGDVDGTGNVGNPRPLGGGINTADVEMDPTPSTDGLTLYFYSEHGLPVDHGRVFVATRASTDADFGAPKLVSEIAVPAEGWVSPSFLSTDRCRLYFYKAETADGNADMFVATRAAASAQ
jgi:hypothetical protein